MTRLNLFCSLVVMILALSTARASEGKWTKFVDCEENRMVLDRDHDRFQVVFREPRVVEELLQSGAVPTHRINSLSEIVLNLLPMTGERSSWIGEDDTRVLMGVVYHVRVRGDSVSFEVHRTTGERDGQYKTAQNVGNWTFGRCSETEAPTTPTFLAGAVR